MNDYLTLDRANLSYLTSLNKTYDEILKINNSDVHMFIWFTNWPRFAEEEENGVPMEKRAPGGATDLGKICSHKRTALIRGPDRDDLETAGVRVEKAIFFNLKLRSDRY